MLRELTDPLPIVCIPGLACSPRLYAEQIPQLWTVGPVSVAQHGRHESVGAITAVAYIAVGSLLSTHISQLCLAQIEFPLDSAPRFIFQLAASIQLIDLLPFGGNQQKFNLVV
jgi:hypothetical protein